MFQYFQKALTTPQALPENMRPTSTTYNGQAALLIPTGSGDYLITSADGKQVYAQSKGGYYSEGQFGIDESGNWVLMDGTSTQYADTGLITLTIDTGALKNAEFRDYKGEVVYSIYGEGGASVTFDSNGDIKNGVVEDLTSGSKTIIRGGEYIKNQNASSIDDLLNQSEPWYEKFNASKLADFTDTKIDEISDFILGEAQDNLGWVLSATAVYTARDIIKGVFTDTLRFGSLLPGALDDFSGSWLDAKNGNSLSAGYQALLGTGKVLQEISRATVFLGVVKGLGTSAARAETASIKEALAAAKASGKQTTVIGHFQDTIIAKDWPGHNVLNLPPADFERLGGWEYNRRWLQSAIDRGDDIYLASELKNPNSYFAKELEYLDSQGFERVGNYMKKKA
ncbi:MAG: hypothetical protein MOGMAGMI_02162 [Candidatus Omnitrophica bacterium]|nr:hypothetical protein [Candidatus Omnitrophota bacterium]